MSFLGLTLLIGLTVAALGAGFWWSGRREPEMPELAVSDDGSPLESGRLPQWGVVVSALSALCLYLLAAAPELALYESGDVLDESQMRSNISVLKRYLDDRYGDHGRERDAGYARAQFHHSELLFALGNYRQASDILRELNREWPEDELIRRHTAATLAFASLQASSQGNSGLAGELRDELKALVESHPQLREQVREIFGAFLQANGLTPDPGDEAPGANRENQDREAGLAGQGVLIRLQLSYPPVEKWPSESILFVSIHDPDAAPGSMPLAAQRHAPPPFPQSLAIGQKDAILPGISLDGYSELLLKARISESGEIKRNKNDKIGEAIVPTDALDQVWPIRLGPPGTAGEDVR